MIQNHTPSRRAQGVSDLNSFVPTYELSISRPWLKTKHLVAENNGCVTCILRFGEGLAYCNLFVNSPHLDPWLKATNLRSQKLVSDWPQFSCTHLRTLMIPTVNFRPMIQKTTHLIAETSEWYSPFPGRWDSKWRKKCKSKSWMVGRL